MLPNHNPRLIGIMIHQVFQHICQFGTQWWDNQPVAQKNQYLRTQLSQSGILKRDIEFAIHQVLTAIDNTLNDPKGQWILHAHKEAQNEYAITAFIENKAQSLILDRTFVESGIRWVIDYKTSTPSDNLEEFIKKEKEKYQHQLKAYVQAMQSIDTRPIRVGLYFPLIPTWCELS